MIIKVGVDHSPRRIYVDNISGPLPLRLSSIEAHELVCALEKAVEFVTEVRLFSTISINVRS